MNPNTLNQEYIKSLTQGEIREKSIEMAFGIMLRDRRSKYKASQNVAKHYGQNLKSYKCGWKIPKKLQNSNWRNAGSLFRFQIEFVLFVDLIMMITLDGEHI